MSTVNSHLFHQTVARRESASCETSRSAPCCSSAGRRCAYVCWSPWTQLKTVQKYAVVDANGVFAPSGATWGNVGRFPGAFGGNGRAEIGDFELQSAMRRSAADRTPMRAKTCPTALLGSCKHILNLGRCHCTRLCDG